MNRPARYSFAHRIRSGLWQTRPAPRAWTTIFTTLALLAAVTLVTRGQCFAQAAQQPSSPGNKYVHASLVFDRLGLQPNNVGEEPVARVGVLLRIEPGWHTYWQNSGEAAIPTKVVWDVPAGWKIGELQWPAPFRFLEKGNIVTFGYRDEVMLWAPVFAPDVVPQDGGQVTFAAKLSWLVCKDICVPGQTRVEKQLSFSTTTPLQTSPEEPLFDTYMARSPISIEQARSTTGNTHLDLKPAVVTRDDAPFLSIVVSGVTSPRDVVPLAQIFPYASKGVSVSRPTSGLSVPAENTGSYTLLAPLKIQDGSADGAYPLQGIIVLAAAATGGKGDIALPWAVSTQLEKGHIVGATVQPTAGTPPTELLFQSVSTHAADSPAAPAAVSSENRVVAPPQLAPATPKQAPEAGAGGLLFALVTAFIGGMILNLMPCVLPIISIKIMGFVGMANETRASALRSALSFASGILFTFLCMALAIVSLRGVGMSLGWGFQFQHPEFIFGLAVVVFFLSLGFFDFYNFELPFMGVANKAASKFNTPFLKHFFDGVLATALSTPCTAPFLGTALAFAFAQPPIFTVMIFMTIGLGLATPYVYFTTQPKVLALLPQPGDWMFRFRQMMGFFLLGTVAWLLFVLHRLTEEGSVWIVVLFLVMFFCFWVRKITVDANLPRGKFLAWNTALIVLFAGTTVRLYPSIVAKRGSVTAHASKLISWVPFSPERLAQAKNEGQPVFIDFTADWCITCKFNEFRLIETEAVATAIKNGGFLALKADWTAGDEVIGSWLKGYGAEGVPLYVILPGNQSNPIVLSTLPSQSSLLDAFTQAAPATK